MQIRKQPNLLNVPLNLAEVRPAKVADSYLAEQVST